MLPRASYFVAVPVFLRHFLDEFVVFVVAWTHERCVRLVVVPVEPVFIRPTAIPDATEVSADGEEVFARKEFLLWPCGCGQFVNVKFAVNVAGEE